MGANGSFAKGATNKEENRHWKTIGSIGENIKILQMKNPKAPLKLPEESHTPNRIYAIFKKNGSDVKCIAQYDSNGKKIWEIHTDDHYGLKPHFHYWKNGGQEEDAHPLIQVQLDLLNTVRNFK
ncbi:MAG: hypothetical protein J6W75_12520 [Bacteroidaceae bacterium]|nr:hypothetical protein [Bacteroidaceae bacterium]